MSPLEPLITTEVVTAFAARLMSGAIIDLLQGGWFEILLPSLQLVLTDAVPQDKREIAQYTLMRLHLRDDERIIRQRREWYRMYQDGGLSLEELEKKAPLIARAIRKSATQARDIKQGNYEHSDDPGF